MTAIVVAPRIEDPLSDTEAVASGGWVQIRPSAAYVAGGQWVLPRWSDPVPLVGVALTFQLDPLPGTPYELRGEIPDGESGVFEIHEFRIVTSSASPLGWETLTQVSGPSGGAVLTGIDQARLTALEAAVGGVSGGASNLASITDMSATARIFNAQTSVTNMRNNLLAVADAAVVHNTTNETVGGIKTFSLSPIVPTPTTSGQAATKGYVDSSAASFNNVTLTGTVTVPDGALAIADTSGLQTALDSKLDDAQLNAASGVAPLNASSRLPAANLTTAVPLEIYYTSGAWPARTTVSPPAGAVVHWYGPNTTPPALTGSPGMAEGDHFHGTA